MQATEDHKSIRSSARAYEQALPPAQRKRLGQYFTGLPLARILAHLSLEQDTETVLDTMAGHGDLLDATLEAARALGIRLKRLDGIEVDGATADACTDRLASIVGQNKTPEFRIVPGDAFDPRSAELLPEARYDLVITNPPYVRYQTRTIAGRENDQIRSGLKAIVAPRVRPDEEEVWQTLADRYSGLADLSIPSWILAASMVRPGGRLALVVPATWRTRNYADVVRYLLLRCFSLECVVEDRPPGWFPDALVRTHLIVARRLAPEIIVQPLHQRQAWPTATLIDIGPRAADRESLVGVAFPGKAPEADLAAWHKSGSHNQKDGVTTREFSTLAEWKALASQVRSRAWYHKLESDERDLPLFSGVEQVSLVSVPEQLRDLLPEHFTPADLRSLRDVGIEVGQGLRTGCNDFFYVTACGQAENGTVLVEASTLFGRQRIPIPSDALRPVLRRQSEITSIETGTGPAGRVLDLRSWALPEDFSVSALPDGEPSGLDSPPLKAMPEGLAQLVRNAAKTRMTSGRGSLIPELSAVRTNARPVRNGARTARFWYMLPDFAPRHQPIAFAPRINHGLPWIEANTEPPILIDANFATFWSPRREWTGHALKALLNSHWCRAFMESVGTPFGGGALKLEATHLARIAVPSLSDAVRADLDSLGRALHEDDNAVLGRIDAIILHAAFPGLSMTAQANLASRLHERAHTLAHARRRDSA